MIVRIYYHRGDRVNDCGGCCITTDSCIPIRMRVVAT